MTSTATVPHVDAAERTARLAAAGLSWSDRIAADPASAGLTYRVTGQAEGAIATRLTAGRHEFLIDEPAGLAGDDAAPSPVEVALGALIACQTVVYRLYAQNLGIRIDSLTATAEGDLDVRGLFGVSDEVRPGFSQVRLTVRVTGPETEERYAELHRVVDRHCPVLDLFANATPVSVELVAN